MKQLSKIFQVVEEVHDASVCEYLASGDGPGQRTIHRFAIDWDADHDERIVAVVEDWINYGWMDRVLAVGERKGLMSVVTTDYGKESNTEKFVFLRLVEGSNDLSVDPMPDEVLACGDTWIVEHVRSFGPCHYSDRDRLDGLIKFFGLGNRGLFIPRTR